MTPDLGAVTVSSVVGSIPWIGILIALVGAVFLAFGAQLQHTGVEIVEERYGSGEKSGLTVAQLLRLLQRPSWVIGTLLLGLAILAQLTALTFAPLIVVQPIGVVALVITALLNARVSKVRLHRKAIRAIIYCVGGVGIFVSVAAIYAVEPIVGDRELLIVLILLGIVLVVLGLAFAFFRKHLTAIFYIVAAGVLYGFVATLAKVVINRLFNGDVEWLTLSCVAALLAAMILGAYFVQTAYSVGSPDLVVAGLTVVDPLVAVAIGIFVLGEAAETPVWAFFVWAAAGAIAVFGVLQLARNHPQTHRRIAPGETPALR